MHFASTEPARIARCAQIASLFRWGALRAMSRLHVHRIPPNAGNLGPVSCSAGRRPRLASLQRALERAPRPFGVEQLVSWNARHWRMFPTQDFAKCEEGRAEAGSRDYPRGIPEAGAAQPGIFMGNLFTKNGNRAMVFLVAGPSHGLPGDGPLAREKRQVEERFGRLAHNPGGEWRGNHNFLIFFCVTL